MRARSYRPSSVRRIAIEYTSSPVEHPACHTRMNG
jgi:hypothetical protein